MFQQQTHLRRACGVMVDGNFIITGGGDGLTDVYKYNVEYANAQQLSDPLNVGRKHHGCATYEESGETKVKIH